MAGLIISVITNKGGTGKTTTAVSLGQALAQEGKKILVVDNGQPMSCVKSPRGT